MSSADLQAVSTAPPAAAPSESCPPPLRCRQVAENWHAIAETWSLPHSRLGTHGTVAGTGPTVYFLNAFGGCAELYTLTSWLLREHCRCVLIDWNSPVDRRRLTLDDFTSDVASVADHLGDQQLAVFGASFGAALATRFAVKFPSRVSHVMLQGAWNRRRLSLGERALAWWYRRSLQSLGSWTSREPIQTANHRLWFPPQDPDRWAWFLELTGTIPLSLMSAQARAIDGVDLSGDYAHLRSSTLFVATEGYGQRNIAEQLRIADSSADFRYEYLHSTGQHPYLTHPHRLAKLIRSHLNGETTAPGAGCCSAQPGAESGTSCCNLPEMSS